MDGLGIAMRTATRTEVVDDVVGDEGDEDSSWLAIGDKAVGCGDGGDRRHIKGLRNRAGRGMGCTAVSVELGDGP